MGTSSGGRIIKVNHAGEFGATNIYRAQIAVARFFRRPYVGMLEEFLEHEKRHLAIFSAYLERHAIRRCRSYWFCGSGGYVLGLVTALLGRKGVMACTAAVESIVTRHLHQQIEVLEQLGDREARDAVLAIVADEENHRDAALEEGFDCPFYKPVYAVVAISTEAVIWLGLRL